ncbi:Crossover junction endonuclease mus81 [Mycoemilia scoparia]|uniref:Crossover junction endonuclease MUS81 n=1 Tax=Mycoemilia scoparia TaxID=417184 RepID=A0A9W8A1B4_9FUNG|nr:Crossover junction endonuclease mus81 [Mycoemilia scoparia]
MPNLKMPRASDSEPEDCANPLFLSWLKEWLVDARRRNLKTQYTLKKAYESLKIYPLPIENPLETTQLNGIGQGIAEKLEKKLQSWRKANNIQSPNYKNTRDQNKELHTTSQKSFEDNMSDSQNQGVIPTSQQSKSNRQARPYIPRYRSGAFAILIALLKFYITDGPDTFIHKAEIIENAQPYCDNSFEVSSNGTKYTAWNSMKTLDSKNLVYRQGVAAKYVLSEIGYDIACQMALVLRKSNELQPEDAEVFSRLENIQQSRNPKPKPQSDEDEISRLYTDDEAEDQPNSAANTNPEFNATCNTSTHHSPSQDAHNIDKRDPKDLAQATISSNIVYKKGEFDIILIMDNREIRTKSDRTYMAREFEKRGIKFDTRPLTVGDYLWVAQPKPGTRSLTSNKELVIDYVIERKRMDDLCSSISDGRLKEQHFRLKNRGFDNVVYVIEGENNDAVQKIGEKAVQTAMSRIQVIDGSYLKRTASFDDTISYLERLTKRLTDKFERLDLYVIPDHLVDPFSISDLKGALAMEYPGHNFCMTYDGYIKATSKSGSIRLQDIFAKMLLTIRGVSAEKAYTIVQEYGTPHRFIKEICNTSSESEQLNKIRLAGNSSSAGPKYKKIGPALAQKIRQVWFSDSY